jgi:hypothetical protein
VTRKRLVVGLALLVFIVVAAWAAYTSRLAKPRPPVVSPVQALVQRCSVQMLRDTCRVMKAPQASQPGARLFIAGLGEVDAAAFDAIRSYGNEMCQAVGAQCTSDWEGANCRIARALYSSPAN